MNSPEAGDYDGSGQQSTEDSHIKSYAINQKAEKETGPPFAKESLAVEFQPVIVNSIICQYSLAVQKHSTGVVVPLMYNVFWKRGWRKAIIINA